MATIAIMNCPSEQDLTAFHLGTLTDEEVDAVGDHLETCTDCQARMQSLDGLKDPVLSLLSGAGTDQPGAATEHNVSSQATTEQQRFDFLSPARGQEEIGWLGPHFCVRRLLGRGGMGMVFAAEDTRLGRLVALKVLRPALAADADARQRFLREARAMAALPGNPHLVPIYDVGEANGVPFLAMEFLHGEPLDQRLARGPRLTLAEIIGYGQDIAAGLAAAHAGGLIHRDIKPANLWVQAPGNTIKILDLGLARAAEEDVKLTGSGIIAGTPAYLSPEQAREQALDARTDLFNLGCVLYEMCAGEPPFRGRTVFALLNAVTTGVPAPLHTVRPDLPAPLADLIMKLLAKRPAERPPSARAVVERLEAIAKLPPGRPRRRRGRAVAILAAGAATILIAAAILLVRTSKGLVEIRTDDPKIRVTVEQDGEVITILDPVSKQQVELRAGEYQVKLLPHGTGLQLSTDHFTLRRGGKEVLTVRRLDDIPKAVDAAWVRQVAALNAPDQVKAVTERLRKLNPDFKSNVVSRIDEGVVRFLEFSTEKVRDISPVRALTGLRGLVCWGGQDRAGQLADLRPLKGLKLTKFDCNGTAVRDLSPLAGMPLEELRIDYCPVTDLTPLRKAPLLSLTCTGTRVKTLAPLTGKSLEVLNCGRTPIADLTPLAGMKLVWLTCDYTNVKDLTPLAGMPLTHLRIGNTPVRDLSPLKGMKLQMLWANDTAIADLSPLRGMSPNLLWFNSSKVRDLSPLTGMSVNEICLDLHGDADLKVLRSLANLKTINEQPAAEFLRKHGKK